MNIIICAFPKLLNYIDSLRASSQVSWLECYHPVFVVRNATVRDFLLTVIIYQYRKVVHYLEKQQGLRIFYMQEKLWGKRSQKERCPCPFPRTLNFIAFYRINTSALLILIYILVRDMVKEASGIVEKDDLQMKTNTRSY